MRFIPDTGAPGINNIPLGLGTSIVKEIRLFFIQDSEIRWEKAFSVSKIGKPFSISHNSDHYANCDRGF
jgi:hypothetical protein